MREHEPASSPGAPERERHPSRERPATAGALALQRAVGNRATGRVLTRWAAHPDKDKKGEFMPDGVAADYIRFNPPKNS